MIMMPLMPHPKYLSSFLHFPFLFSLMLLSVLLTNQNELMDVNLSREVPPVPSSPL